MTVDVPPTKEETDLLKKLWAKKHGLKESNGRSGWCALIKAPYKKPPFAERWNIQDGDDHCSLWNKDGKPYCWVSQPYGLSFGNLQKMFLRAEKYGLVFEVNAWPAWHFPSSVLFVTWRHK